MSKMIPYADAAKIYDKVLAIDPDSIEVVHNERPYQKEFAKDVRTFLKGHGLTSRDISVTSAVGSMCYWINVNLPHIDRGKTYFQIQMMSAADQEAFFAQSRVMEDHRHDACRHLSHMIARAFPGCVDRSDSMIDYFDFMYTVH